MTDCLNCDKCILAPLCALSSHKIELSDPAQPVAQRQRCIRKRTLLVQSGDTMRNVYLVRQGALKSFRLNVKGREQISDFHFPGDIIGFDGLIDGSHRNYTEALIHSQVCVVPIQSIDSLTNDNPTAYRHMLSVLSHELFSTKALLSLVNHHSAQQRLARFLISLYQRWQQFHHSSGAFELPMTRADIGNYLGVSEETISRVFSQLRQDKVIRVQRKIIEITQPERLSALAG